MTIRELKEVLNAEIIVGHHDIDREVFAACGSDLMSDVLAFVKEKVVLLTGLINPQVIRTAEMMDIRAIVFVRGKKPTEDVIQLAQSKDIAILTTNYTLYVSCGMLYRSGLNGES